MARMAAGGQEVVQQEERLTRLRPVELPAAISVSDLAVLLDIGPVEIIKELMRGGYMLTINDVLDHDVATIVARVFGYHATEVVDSEEGAGSLVIGTEGEDPDALSERPPVVTILGHVDHGKTTLLDTIRRTNVVAGEAGGITQHIGAYQAEFNGNPITFLDTPGHAAFTAMRARGARVTDIAVLVVAADDGIMPQTIEAIDHARAAGIPIMVAINKADLPSADPDRVKRQLSENGLLVEEWGGDVIAVPMSALKGDGVDDLLENLLVVAEVSEFKANPDRNARGIVVEAKIDKSKGPVATLLVQTGTLSVGDSMVIGTVRGRVKALLTETGERIGAAGPSRPVEVLGLDSIPEAGEIFEVAEDEKVARRMVQDRQRQIDRELAAGPTLEDVHARIEAGDVKALNLIVKTDVQGTIEAVRTALDRLSPHETRLNLVHIASGSITDSDVLLATASQAIVVGFNSPVEPGARALANQNGVEIRFYDVIYHLTEDIERALEGMLEPVYDDVLDGRAVVRAVFDISRRGKVAGIYVSDGRMARDATIHVLRGGQELFAGRIASLKHFKDDVRSLATGFEGGVRLDGFADFLEGDILEAYRSERTR
jgi:translation initiation factor IF-2